ncbi:hypothetical protein AS200_09510 [Streptomyces sp. CdTB01]|nr:hypothetical protein AS200_09510 [Streptomyces sp. CdTB01]
MRQGGIGVRRGRWWSWLADSAVVVTGGLAAAGLIVGLGWGRQGGWRLIASAGVGLLVAAMGCELPVALAREHRGSVPADVWQGADGSDAEPHG